MNWTPAQLSKLIRSRRSVFPKNFISKAIPRDLIEEILENANWAPTHKKTEPWRFQVFRGEAKEQLGQYLANHYKENCREETYLESRFQKNIKKAAKSSCIIAICMQRDPEERIPEWEEVAAVACAVQNMWLTCAAYGIGCYWSSPASILGARDFLELKEGQRCLGLMYMGYAEEVLKAGSRKPISEKVRWR